MIRLILLPFFLCVHVLCRAEQSAPDAALQRLMEGNARFVAGKSTHTNLADEGLSGLKEGQAPFAAILGCSDSRVPPEIIFDQGLGDLFVVRVAGNVVGPIELDSVQYTAEHLHSSVIVVLGHENCGAVKATMLGQKNVPELANIYPLIAPALKTCKGQQGNVVEQAIKCNAVQGAQYLRSTPQLSRLIAEKKLKIVAGYYNFDDGKVTILPD
jgi:carbonic anhydrase